MPRIPTITQLLALLLLLGLFSPDASQASQLTSQERHGKQIYLRGESPSDRRIMALVGGGSVEVPATTLPCANCHGLDGRGRPEAGVVPSDIRWQTLTKSYGITHASGRKHPAYTASLLGRAITEGSDAAGNELGVSMPRYRMSGGDLADLVAYLKYLGSEQDPGLSRTGIILGTIRSSRGPLAEIGRAAQAVMAAYFDEINQQGGIYDRKLRLRAIEPTDTISASRTALDRAFEREPVFGMVGAFIPGAEQEISSLAEREGVPLVGPFTLFPPDGLPPNRYVFYLLPGLKEQARALVEFAAQRHPDPPPRVAIISPAEESSQGVGGAVEEQCRKHGWNSVTKIEFSRGASDPARLAQQAARDGAEAVFFLGSGNEALLLMQAAERIAWQPDILQPGLLVGREIFEAPAVFRNRLFLAYPTLPSDQTAVGIGEYRSLAARHRLPPHHLAAQLSAYAAARVFVEGLKRAGKEVSRERLVTILEGLYQFQTGVTPPITYGPNRRIGALGAYIVRGNPEEKSFGMDGQWMSLE